MKVRDLIRQIEAGGWKQVRQRGSHRHFKHAVERSVVTIPGKLSAELAPGTLCCLLKLASVKL